MKSISLDLLHFAFLLFMLCITAWVWMKSLVTCPKNYSNEYTHLYKKYIHVVNERDSLKKTVYNLQNSNLNSNLINNNNPSNAKAITKNSSKNKHNKDSKQFYNYYDTTDINQNNNNDYDYNNLTMIPPQNYDMSTLMTNLPNTYIPNI